MSNPTPRTRVTPALRRAAVGCASLATCLAAALPVGAAVSADPTPVPTLHVATNGSDRAPGSATAPLRSISAAVAAARPGATIEIAGGVYHEHISLEADKAGVTLKAAPGAQVWLDGSSRVTGFQQEGGHWVRPGWTVEFDSSPTYEWGKPDNKREYWSFINPRYPMAAHPDQVWVDDRPQRQVASLSRLRPGTFYADYDADRLYLGSDPTGRQVRASTLAQALSIRAPRATVSDIDVRRFAPSVPHMGAVTVEADGITVSRMQVVQNATTGMHVLSDDVRLNRILLKDNGMMGLGTNGADRLRINRMRAIHNNTEHFNIAPASGGVKIGHSVDVVVRNSRFSRNLATGLWFDVSNYRMQVVNSRFVRNRGHGLHFEVSGTALAVGNMLRRNRQDGIRVNDVDHAQLWNNTVVGSRRPINIVQDDRDVNPAGTWRDWDLPLTWQNSPVTVRNNIVALPARRGDCLLCVEDYSGRWSAEQQRITADSNLYQRPSGRAAHAVIWSRGAGNPAVFQSVDDFRQTTGQERSGLQVIDRVVTRRFRPTALTQGAFDRATALPDDVAAVWGVPAGSRVLGARAR